jgi:hypothetical protein
MEARVATRRLATKADLAGKTPLAEALTQMAASGMVAFGAESLWRERLSLVETGLTPAAIDRLVADVHDLAEGRKVRETSERWYAERSDGDGDDFYTRDEARYFLEADDAPGSMVHVMTHRVVQRTGRSAR